MTSKNLEKEFDINIVASFIENKVLIVLDKNDSSLQRKKKMKKFERDLFDFCSFVSGVNIDYSNLSLYAHTIKNILIEQYPEMSYKLLNFDEYKMLNNNDIINAIMRYKELYGDKLLVKSVKKEIIKSLKLQDN